MIHRVTNHRDALVEEAPAQIIHISDDRISCESWDGLAFHNIDTFRAVMEADGQGDKVDDILSDPDLLETLTFTGETWEGERRPGEIISGPVYRSGTGLLWVVPSFESFLREGYSCNITCIHTPFQDFA